MLGKQSYYLVYPHLYPVNVNTTVANTGNDSGNKHKKSKNTGSNGDENNNNNNNNKNNKNNKNDDGSNEEDASGGDDYLRQLLFTRAQQFNTFRNIVLEKLRKYVQMEWNKTADYDTLTKEHILFHNEEFLKSTYLATTATGGSEMTALCKERFLQWIQPWIGDWYKKFKCQKKKKLKEEAAKKMSYQIGKELQVEEKLKTASLMAAASVDNVGTTTQKNDGTTATKGIITIATVTNNTVDKEDDNDFDKEFEQILSKNKNNNNNNNKTLNKTKQTAQKIN